MTANRTYDHTAVPRRTASGAEAFCDHRRADGVPDCGVEVLGRRHYDEPAPPRPEYAGETNPIDPYHRELHDRRLPAVDWTDPELLRVTRFRILTDPGFPAWDVSYCYGELADGNPVEVRLPFHQLPKRWRAGLVREAIAAGVNAKALGFFDAVSTVE